MANKIKFRRWGTPEYRRAVGERFDEAIANGATVRFDNKQNQQARVVAGNGRRSLIDFGADTEWYPNERLWVEVK